MPFAEMQMWQKDMLGTVMFIEFAPAFDGILACFLYTHTLHTRVYSTHTALSATQWIIPSQNPQHCLSPDVTGASSGHSIIWRYLHGSSTSLSRKRSEWEHRLSIASAWHSRCSLAMNSFEYMSPTEDMISKVLSCQYCMFSLNISIKVEFNPT